MKRKVGMERKITDGDQGLGATPGVRLIRAVVVFAVLGLYVIFVHATDMSAMKRIMLFAAIIAVAFPSWGYLEFRNIVISRAQQRGTLGWRTAAFALHPVMLPIYFIAMPVAIYLVIAWFNHNHPQPRSGREAAPEIISSTNAPLRSEIPKNAADSQTH